MKKEIGGYFSILDDVYRKACDRWEMPFENGVYYQSGRACVGKILEEKNPDSIALPKFICDSVVNVVKNYPCDIIWYDIDEKLQPLIDERVKNASILYIVNYFGLRLPDLPKDYWARVIVDNAQGFFIPPSSKALASIYSPRKFLPVADGGCLVSSLNISEPDDTFYPMLEHMILRAEKGAKAGYKCYLQAEASLSEYNPLSMSNYSRFIMKSADLSNIERIRRNNYELLHQSLAVRNRLKIPNTPESPLCYPYLASKVLKQYLIRNNIFVATYWQEVSDRVLEQSWEQDLVDNLVCIPIDHRYDSDDMNYIIEMINRSEHD